MRARAAVPAGLGALIALSALLRTQRLDVGFWIDEALSVGIADRPLGEIPDALRLDGSPPLYYALLHVWMRLTGDRSEEVTHLLSVLLALATVPVAFFLLRALVSERAGWAAAVLFAVNPFLTQYAEETRMYALVILLGTIACATFAGAFMAGKSSRWPVAFAVALVALLYTHNWGLFLGAGFAVAWLALLHRDRTLLRRGLLTFGAVAIAYAPWLPALVFQAQHTGAPWARAPVLEHLTKVPGHLLGTAAFAVLALVGIHLARRVPRIAVVLLGVGIVTVLLAWLASQLSPAWATRYLAIGVPPLVLAGALLVERAGRVGTIALGLVAFLSLSDPSPPSKSNVRIVSNAIAPALRSGDLVISTQPEQAPALAYYLSEQVEGLRWATIFGPLTDLGVTDWRDGVERMQRLTPERDLAPLLDAAPAGSRVALVEPEVFDIARWSAPWTALVRVRSNQWRAWMLDDPRFRVVAVRPDVFAPPAPNPVRATLFLKVGMR